MKKIVKRFAVMLAVVLGVMACNKEEAPVSTITDYYIEVAVSGGDLDAAELNEIQAELNSDLSGFRLEACTQDEAIYEFDTLVKELKSEFNEGDNTGFSGTLKITLILKTTSGQKVKSSTLNVTRDGCTIS